MDVWTKQWKSKYKTGLFHAKEEILQLGVSIVKNWSKLSFQTSFLMENLFLSQPYLLAFFSFLFLPTSFYLSLELTFY